LTTRFVKSGMPTKLDLGGTFYVKMHTDSLSLLALCLALAAVPAMADVYNNGPINGTIDAWPINSGFANSDSFTVASGGANLAGLSFGAWLFPGDTLTSVEVSITSGEFGGTVYFDQTLGFSEGTCVMNQFGFNVCTETANFNTTLNGGTYWLNLQNAVVPNGDPVYWDENYGPSLASENTIGTIYSEAFTIQGSINGTGTTPEVTSILLFGTGVLGLAGNLRRKINF
jgi:hypothetical protein